MPLALATPSQQLRAAALPSGHWPALQVKNTFLELPPNLPPHWQSTNSSRRAQSAPPALAEVPEARITSAPIAFGELTPQSESEAATILASLPSLGAGGCHPLGAFEARPSAASASTCSSVRSTVAYVEGDMTTRENTDYTFISRENTFLSRENTFFSRENTFISGESMPQVSRENTAFSDLWISPTNASSHTQAWMQWPPMPPPPASTAPQLAPMQALPPPPVAPPRSARNHGRLEKKVRDMYELGSPQLPTEGSVGHYFRKCKPCAFVFKDAKGGCANGTGCQFCHLCEPGEKRRRQQGLVEKRKQRREKRCQERDEQEHNSGEQRRLQEFEEYAEEGYIGALSNTTAPHIAAPHHRNASNRDAPEGHAARPFASRAARPFGGGHSSRDGEQLIPI